MNLHESATHVIILATSLLPRMAWEALLERQPGIVVWGTAANLDDLLALPQTGTPTTVLLDLPQPLPLWSDQLSSTMPNYGLLSLVDEYDLEQTVALLQAGITGILSRDATLPELTRGLLAVARGEIVLPPSLAARALTALARGEVHPRQHNIESLTDREQDVLSLLAQGMTNKDIAQSLFLSVRTIEAHLRNIYSKLAVGNRTEAVLWAVQHGFEA
jgi:DNA-binding NarL/FixJ family response regulator